MYLRCERHSGETTDLRRSNSPSDSAPETYSTAALAPSTNSARLNSGNRETIFDSAAYLCKTIITVYVLVIIGLAK